MQLLKYIARFFFLLANPFLIKLFNVFFLIIIIGSRYFELYFILNDKYNNNKDYSKISV